MARFAFFIFFFLLSPELFAQEIASHQAVYEISLESTKQGAASVVNATGKMQYTIQKVCNTWETESVFSLDVAYELMGTEKTNWKQITKETLDGCSFDFDVFVREDAKDRKDFSGKAICEGNKKKVSLALPIRSEASFPRNVFFPVQQTARLLSAAKKGEKTMTSYVYDGTRPEAFFSMNAVFSKPLHPLSTNIEGDVNLLKDKETYHVDTAFFEEFKTPQALDGAPSYEVSLDYYENAISDNILQDFGNYRLKSTLKSLKSLKEIPCP